MDDSQEISLTEKQRHWLEHLQACEASGKGIAVYAVDQGLDARTLYAGKKILVKKGVLPRTGGRMSLILRIDNLFFATAVFSV